MTNPVDTDTSPSFSESFTTLEAIVSQFKSGTPSLEDAMVLFEDGVRHIKLCQAQLGKARGRVEELVKTLQADGEVVTQPFSE
jgi:exodeoxyribonuclease VII small subunit